MDRRELLQTTFGALCIFAVARLVFAVDLDIVYDEGLWQLAPPAWLAGKSLWSVILSFHAQPPGLLMLQWAGANVSPWVIDISLLFAAATYVGCCGVIATAVSKSRTAGLLTALFVALHPSTLLYSHWFFSPIFLAAFVAVSLVMVVGWARSGNVNFLAWALAVLSLASLFHAAYLPALLFSILLLLFLPSVRSSGLKRPGFLVPVMFSLAIGFFAPVKNFMVFEIFSASSWARLNLANVYTDQRPWQHCRQMVRASNANAEDLKQTRASAYADRLDRDLLFKQVKPRGDVNLNHFEMLRCQNGVPLAGRFDSERTKINIVRSLLELASLPAWDHHLAGSGNLQKIENLVRVSELFVGRGKNPRFEYEIDKQFSGPEGLVDLASIPTLLLSVVVYLSCSVILTRILIATPRYWRSRGALDFAKRSVRDDAAIVYAAMLAGLILAIMILANAQELNRMRFSLAPLFIAILAWALRMRLPRLSGTKHPPVNEPPQQQMQG